MTSARLRAGWAPFAGSITRTEDFVEVLRTATGGRGVDVTLDMVAGAYVARNLDIAALEGRIVVISLLGGARAEVNFGLVLTKRLTITGSTLRSRTVAQKAMVADGVRKNVLAAAGRGQGAPRSYMRHFRWPRHPRRTGSWRPRITSVKSSSPSRKCMPQTDKQGSLRRVQGARRKCYSHRPLKHREYL